MITILCQYLKNLSNLEEFEFQNSEYAGHQVGRKTPGGSVSLYRKIISPKNHFTEKFWPKGHLTETPFDRTPLTECHLTETSFDRIAV
jgi:hypothetical protein